MLKHKKRYESGDNPFYSVNLMNAEGLVNNLSMRYLPGILAIIFYLSITGCAGNKPIAITGAVQPAGRILAAWSQIIGPDTIVKDQPLIVARFIVQGIGQHCEDYSLRSASVELKPAARDNPDPGAFPVTLCQVELPADATRLTLFDNHQTARLWFTKDGFTKDGLTSDGVSDDAGAEIIFSGAASIGNRHKNEVVMVTMGDTGCRGNENQPDCQIGSPDWPFHDLIKTAASQFDPDLVIHVGDYRYFQAGRTADTWEFWYQDFFSAAQPLLLTAPWAFSRGNHEQCHNSWQPHWYGMGWFYLFEPTTSLQTTRCPQKPHPAKIAPWYFDITVPGIEPHRFIMLDTAAQFPENEPARQRYLSNLSDNFTIAIDWARDVPDAWWVTHRPFLSLSYYNKKWHYADDNVRAALNTALENNTPLCNRGCLPNTIIAGHIHRFQTLELFAPDETSGDWMWPQSVITGNSGVNLVESLNASPCSYHFPENIAATGVVNSRSEHGFIAWRRSSESRSQPSGWIAEPYFIHSTGLDTHNTLIPCGPEH